jgi:hypothetical protein
MGVMSKKYLDPAYSLILRFSPTGELSKGIDSVAAITGADRTRVYRWMRPKDVGGTGGLIPSRQQKKLFEHAKETNLRVELSDFFGWAA